MQFDNEVRDYDMPTTNQVPGPVAAKRRKRKTVNYSGENRGRSGALQDAMVAYLAFNGSARVVELAQAAGISRTLAHYHVRKLMAFKKIAVMVEQAEGTQWERFRVWHPVSLARSCVAWLEGQRLPLHSVAA